MGKLPWIARFHPKSELAIAAITTDAPSLSRTATRGYWLFGPEADRGWFVWSVLIPLALYLPAYWSLGSGVVWPLYLMYAACFATPHTWLTWAVTLPRSAHGMYRPRALWEPIFYTALLAVGVPLTHRFGGWDLLFTLITLIGFYHVTKQHLGILRMYDAKYAQIHTDPGIFAAMAAFHRLMVLLLAFPLFRVWQLPLFEIAIGPQKFTLLHPILPAWTKC